MTLLKPLYSRKRTECELQAELFYELKQRGLDPRLEVVGYLPDQYRARGRRKCRFDVVVFWPLNHKAICIIECKGERRHRLKKSNSQIARYKQFGLPVFACFFHNKEKVIDQIISISADQIKRCPPSLRDSLGAITVRSMQ